MAYCPEAFGIVGHPVTHSLSPRLHDAALRACTGQLSCTSIPAHYERWDVPPERFDAFVHHLRSRRAAGNVTMPHKTAMYRKCDALTAAARRSGAVNTFAVDRAGVLHGHNTDIDGASAAIGALLHDIHRVSHVTVLGAGGSAAAVVHALTDTLATAGATLCVVSRSAQRAAPLLGAWSGTSHHVRADLSSTHDSDRQDVARALTACDLVINCTPIGMGNQAQPCAAADLSRTCRVLDVVYAPGGTAWVRACRAHGVRADDGTRMLVEQAAAAFAWWFGVVPPVSAMWDALGAEHAEG